MWDLSELGRTVGGVRHHASPNVADARPSGIRRVPSRVRGHDTAKGSALLTSTSSLVVATDAQPSLAASAPASSRSAAVIPHTRYRAPGTPCGARPATAATMARRGTG